MNNCQKKCDPTGDAARDLVLGNMVRAIRILESCREFAALVPEVRVNLVFALPDAATPGDVAAVDGRLTHVRGWPHASGLPTFGASDHMARLIIEARRCDPSLRAGINFAWTPELCARLAAAGMDPVMIDRTAEPADVAAQDGHSIPWKIRTLASLRPTFPRLFFEGPGMGKEPLFVLLGQSAVDVAIQATGIARGLD